MKIKLLVGVLMMLSSVSAFGAEDCTDYASCYEKGLQFEDRNALYSAAYYSKASCLKLEELRKELQEKKS